MATKLDSRQVVLREVNPFIGNAANEQLNVVFPRIDAEMAKLYEDRNIFLTDGGIITFTGTQIQFTEALNLVINQKISGAAPQIISLGSANVNLANGEMWYAVVNRTAGTAVMAVASTLPAVVAANQEVFLIVKRVDAGDGTQRIYWRTGMAQNAGQSNRLGASGSGSGGSGIGDDLNALLFRASFRDPFEEGPTDTKSAVDTTAGFTDATTYNAAKAMYVLNYDASKTIAASTTTTNIELSAVASFTVKIGDVVIANNQARRITAVASQSSFTTEAFSVAPTLASQVTVSQAIYTKDVYNFAVDGNALSAAFSGQTFQDVLIDYEDTTTAGDNIFDVNVAPVVGMAASQNGTAFSDVKIRPTLETDQVQSFLLPAAGTGLYMRFFAYKTSGSGTVNVLGYRAFMQKLAADVAGGITNSSYAFTNGVGTPINATVSVVGGKTTITLPWAYAIGVLPGTTASSIEVWLNGQKLPRFVNSTLTPDGSFLETSSNVVTLDRDYSFQNLAVEIFQRTQIVDNSTVNTTNIAYQQEVMQNGFQAFVAQNQLMNATTSAGTPAAGSFYSSIVGRAAIVDLSQDLRVRMGIERIQAQSISQIQNEFGPNGELVWGLTNDLFGQIRFVGSWQNNAELNGAYPVSPTTLNDYIEVTFFGTGLNILVNSFSSGRDYRASVDGGAEGSNIYPSGSSILINRNYASNVIAPVVSGLALGVHTVRIRNNAASQPIFTHGFEILTETSSLRVNPGVSYVNGQKEVLSSIQSIAYNSAFESGTLGTRGGRVVVYQKSDGTIAKAVTPADSQGAITASGNTASHANEEVIRTYNFREFGVGRTDDFSGTMVAAADRAFTLDDGTTTLIGDDINADASGVKEAIVLAQAANSSILITFVGTGLDIFVANTSAPSVNNVQVSINGATAISVNGANWVVRSWNKIVSGLPYGTHTVKFTQAVGGTGLRPSDFKIWGPKKPAIPSGAIELADYFVMANHVLSGVSPASGVQIISSGVLRKTAQRENVYVGAGWNIGGIIPSDATGVQIRTPTSGDYVEYTFFGTGVNVIGRGGGAATAATISFNGVLYTGAATMIGGGSWTPGTSTWGTSTTENAGISISGLTLGKYTIRVTKSNATDQLSIFAFDVITPIHSPKSNIYSILQNALSVGSCGISDNRKVTPVKDLEAQPKAWAQSIGLTSGPTTTSTSFVPMPEMSCSIKTNGGDLKINYTACSSQTGGAGNYIAYQIYLNGIAISLQKYDTHAAAGQDHTVSESFRVKVSPGVHKVDIYWRVGSGTAVAEGTTRTLLVEEV